MSDDSTDFEDVIVTAAYLMEKNPQCEMWSAYQERRYGIMGYSAASDSTNATVLCVVKTTSSLVRW